MLSDVLCRPAVGRAVKIQEVIVRAVDGRLRRMRPPESAYVSGERREDNSFLVIFSTGQLHNTQSKV